MIQTFRTRTTSVPAIQFNGENLADLEVAVKEVCDREAFFAPLMEVGCWVLLTAPAGDRGGSYQVLPDAAFRRVYEPTEGFIPLLPVAGRTCFSCAHYVPGESHCFKYDERIDSEVLAASDCDEFSVTV